MKRIYNYRTKKLYEFEAGGRDYDMTYHHYQRSNQTVPELDPIFIELHSIGQRCHNLDKSIEYGAKGTEYVSFDVNGKPTYAFYYAPQIKKEWDYIEHFLANRSPNVYDNQNPTPEELLDLIPHLDALQRLGKNNKGVMSDLSEICDRCVRAINKYVADFNAKNRANESINESDEDVVMYKLCVREEALVEDAEVEEDDVEFEDRYDSLEDALADVDDAMTKAAETEDEDFTELDCDDCNDCRVFESPSKRYIFVACPEDEEPNFDIDVEDDGEFERDLDIPVDDDFEDELEADADSDFADDEYDDDDYQTESVAAKFAKLRSIFEAEGEDESGEDDSADDSAEGADAEGEEGENADAEGEESDAEGEDESLDEDEEMTAVAITVKTDDVDACKDELIDAGVAEDDIEVLEDKDGETEIRIDVNSVMELKDYLSKKGIDLEEEIGGEIVSDDDESDSEGEENGEGEGEDDPDAEQEVPEFDIDDLGDIFGAEE